MNRSMPGLTVHHQLPEFTQTHAHQLGDVIQPSHPLSSPSPPAPNPSQHQGLFQWVNSSHEVFKVLEFQLQHQSFQWTPGLISFRMDWFDLLAVQGTLKSLLQHHSSKASILRCSVFFIVQLSHPYTTTGKTIALTRQTFVGKVMSLLFNTLSRLVISFLPRSKHLLIREEPLISYCILRGTLTSLLQLKRNPEFTLAAREEDQLPDATQEEPWCPLLQLKKDKSIWTNLPSDFVYFLASDFVF